MNHPDPLHVPDPAEPPMSPRAKGCVWAALIGASMAFWAVVILAAVQIVAAPSEAQSPAASPAGTGLRGAPLVSDGNQSVREARESAVGRHRYPGLVSGGAPFRPAAAMPSASTHDVSMPAPSPRGGIGTALLGGVATWFDTCARCAAAGPQLRSMLGPSWRGMVITVEGPGSASVTVELTDWCACGERHGRATLIDLSRDAFARLAHPSAGIVAVSIEVGTQLPATSTEAQP